MSVLAAHRAAESARRDEVRSGIVADGAVRQMRWQAKVRLFAAAGRAMELPFGSVVRADAETGLADCRAAFQIAAGVPIAEIEVSR